MPKASKFIEDKAKDGSDDNGEDGQHKVYDVRGDKGNGDYDIAAGEEEDVAFFSHDNPIDHHVDNDCFMDVGLYNLGLLLQLVFEP